MPRKCELYELFTLRRECEGLKVAELLVMVKAILAIMYRATASEGARRL